jgi:hypothetical protein
VAYADYFRRTLDWASRLRAGGKICSTPTVATVTNAFKADLSEYFRLCALARSSKAPSELSREANGQLFRCRTLLEKAVHETLLSSVCGDDYATIALFARGFFGKSKKQGVSVRMPLTSCIPTALCGAACYAHDVLDATPQSVVRGAINGWFATLWERGDHRTREHLLGALQRPTEQAVKAAFDEIRRLPRGFVRRPYIRFSHVGEVVAYAGFANAVAALVKKLSRNRVDCVIYTRHRHARSLTPDLWVINFTLDPSSEDRRAWAPSNARLVYSAFNGSVSGSVAVNFLEHHRHSHMAVSVGTGTVCPATAPEAPDRTCDGCRCKTCFEPVTEVHGIAGSLVDAATATSR